MAGEPIDAEWTAFKPETGTKAVPRAEMPQIKAEHRGALTQFLKARGIVHEQEADVDPRTLKPTQAEFSPGKVQKAREFEGGDRAILVSSDGHILDGHHQWLKALEDGQPIRTIRLDAPIDKLMEQAREFPSAETSEGAGQVIAEAPAPVEPKLDTPAPAPASAEDAPQARWTRATEADRLGVLGKAGWSVTPPSLATQRMLRVGWDKMSDSQRQRIASAMDAAVPVANPRTNPAASEETQQAPAPAPAPAPKVTNVANNDALLMPPDAVAALKGKRIDIKVAIGDTGKTATMSMDAADAVNDVQKRMEAAQQLLRCLA